MVANIECYKSKAEMIREKIKAGDFFTIYYLGGSEVIYPKHYCWPIRSIAHAITVNMEQQYVGCNIIYPPRNVYRETFHALIDLEGWRWRYDFDFLFDEKGIRSRKSTSNEIFRYISEFSTYVQDEGKKE